MCATMFLMETAIDKFGERLRLAVEDKGWNQADLARALGVSRSAAAKWFGGSDMAAGNLRRAADVLGVSYDWLATGNGERRQKRSGGGMPEGMKIEVNDLGSQLSKPLLAAMEGRRAEVWKLSTDLLTGANYQPGDYLIVDLSQPAKARDFVLAEVNRTPIFRMFLPPYLYSVAAPGLVNPMPLTVDNLSVIVLGVIVSRFSLS